jgi:hypothetical protein
MWKVKRMITARIVVLVLAIAIGAGGVDACPVKAAGDRPAAAAPVVQMRRAGVVSARADIDRGQAVKPQDLKLQSPLRHSRFDDSSDVTEGYQI